MTIAKPPFAVSWLEFEAIALQEFAEFVVVRVFAGGESDGQKVFRAIDDERGSLKIVPIGGVFRFFFLFYCLFWMRNR